MRITSGYKTEHGYDFPVGVPFDGALIDLPGKLFVMTHCEHGVGRVSCRNCMLEGNTACKQVCCTRGKRADKTGARVDIFKETV